MNVLWMGGVGLVVRGYGGWNPCNANYLEYVWVGNIISYHDASQTWILFLTCLVFAVDQ